MTGTVGKDLYQFLEEAELEHYYNTFKNDLKINSVPQIKYIEDDDLAGMGMSKPEMRRLRKFFKKECPQGTFGKLMKIMSTKHSSSYNIEQSDVESRRSPPHVRVPSKHIISADAITVNKIIGQGEFGTVQQGIWTNEDGERIQVAIKCLGKERMHTGLTEFLKEATNMHAIDHEHIVRLYGVVLDTENSLMLVTELAPLRSLLECLKEPNLRASFPVSTLCEFAHQIADGMSYLESKRLIHRDLAARNILVFAKDKVKVSDFGLSRALGVGKDYYQTNFNVNLKLPIAWCAPESISYLKFTSASDVWSYGVTLWEMFSYGFQPWAGLTGQQILDAIDEPACQRLEQPDCCPKEYYNLMLKCWDADSKRRPKFCELVLTLPQIKPEVVKIIRDSTVTSKDYIFYQTGDLITVLDKKPQTDPTTNVWLGVTSHGKTGFFSPNDITMFTLDAPAPAKTKVLLRKESSRKGRAGSHIRKDMISRPANDLRHTGHIGYDGAVFGDISFIGDNVDKLPVKVVNPYKPQDDIISASPPLSKSPVKDISPISTISSVTSSDNEKRTLKNDEIMKSEKTTGYTEINDDLDGFKTPDFSLSLDLDFGSSFMDDVLKAFGDTDKTETTSQPSDGTPSSRETTPEGQTDKQATNGTDDVGLHDSMTSHSKGREKRKSKLRIMIPKSEKKQAKVKPLSAADERQLDNAMELANQLDPISTPRTPKSPKETDSQDPETPGRPKSLFSFKLSKKVSPKVERRTFTEEMEQKKDDDMLSPEAEEAYNLLVVKGSVKKKEPPLEKNKQESSPPRSSPPKSSPKPVPRGVAKNSTHPQTSPRNGDGLRRSPKNDSPKESRLEISAPIITGGSTLSEHSANSRGPSASPKVSERTEHVLDKDSSDSSESESKGQQRRFLREERVRRSIEHHRSSLSDHSDSEKREKNLKQPAGVPARDTSDDSAEVDTNPLRRLRGGGGIVPVPRARTTRQGGARSAIIPLADHSVPSHMQIVDNIRVGAKTQSFVRERGNARSRVIEDETGRNDYGHNRVNPVPLPPKRTSSIKQPVLPDLNGKQTNVVKPSSLVLSDEPKASPLPKRFNLQNVKCNAEQLGLDNDWDLFWTKNVQFEKQQIDEDGMPSMNAKYKTSDNVSYEDLLDFAVEDENTSPEQKDKIQEMQKVLSKGILAADCLEALQATNNNFQKAVKYIKLKQLLSLLLGDVNRCKEALMRCKWDIEEAADYLLNNPIPSPECVDV